MSAEKDNPPNQPDKRDDTMPSTGGLDDDAALRETIARLLCDECDSPPIDTAERQDRLATLRRQIEEGEYMSSERVADVVDRLLRKWHL